MLATHLFRGRWRERQEAGPLLAPAYVRDHEDLRGGERLSARPEDLHDQAAGVVALRWP
jgi:hypothetical protein